MGCQRCFARPCLAGWLDDVGLPQYKSHFDEARVDACMLHYMTVVRTTHIWKSDSMFANGVALSALVVSGGSPIPEGRQRAAPPQHQASRAGPAPQLLPGRLSAPPARRRGKTTRRSPAHQSDDVSRRPPSAEVHATGRRDPVEQPPGDGVAALGGLGRVCAQPARQRRARRSHGEEVAAGGLGPNIC